MDITVKTPQEETTQIDDLIIPEDVLYTNNTFSLRALNETLERLSLTNFWSLYQTQRARLHMERFDIPFNEFNPIFRLTGEKTKDYYPRRHIAYVNYPFVGPELRKKYRNSELYNSAINQEQIANNPDLFRYNHLVFINGDYIFTTEIYPQENKTGIIIDIESNRNEHGLTYADFIRFKETNPMVTIFMVPNFSFTNITTNPYVVDKYQNRIPFDKIKGSDKFTDNTICFLNDEEKISRRFWSPKIACNIADESVDFQAQSELNAVGPKYHVAFITFSNLFDIRGVNKDHPYFQLNTKMPCPKEHLFTMVRDELGNYRFSHEVTVEMYYPNIYKFNGLKDGEVGMVFVFQDEETVTEAEEYTNELAKYEEYVSMLPQYEAETIPDVIKRYRPASFIYSIDDYEGSVYVPDTMNYKVQKLHKAIYENPWALAVYLDLLNLPIDKFFLDMEKLDLDSRIRRDSSREDTDHGVPVAHFDEDRYVFAMNRHLVDTRNYGFRVFIDGFFQLEKDYTILPGPNFYFIYIPVSKIQKETMIEIERYKLFTIEQKGTANTLEDPVLELDFTKDRQMIGYSREIYAINLETMMFIPKERLRIEVLYKFAERSGKWTEIPCNRNIPLENKVRVYLTDERYLGKPLRVGIQRRMSMATGEQYHPPENAEKDVIYWHSKGIIRNFGGNDRGNYRIFNNGRILLPIQYYINLSEKYGGEDFFRTGTELFDGDQFTIDHVPAQFRVVYYQHEIDSEGKKGYVNLDGKIALPISLKWYDIYINGQKLHKKNIEILSPTRFYVQGVESRTHLLIVVRNRDAEIFHFPFANMNALDTEETPKWNTTVIDDLMDLTGGLKDTIDQNKSIIDWDNSAYNVATKVCININALIFFFEHFMHAFINANKAQITQAIKDIFPMLLLGNGVMPIDSNDGCIRSKAIGGYLIKPIDCNIQKGEDDMFTDPNVNYDGIGALQDRFAIRPLNTDNYQFGLREEFMIDPNTAEPAIVNKDGTITAINTMTRLKSHIEVFNSNITLFGMGRADIYQITFDNEYKTHLYKNNGDNMLTGEFNIPAPAKRVCVSVDATFLTQYDDCKMLKVADIDPTITVGWTANGVDKSFSCRFTRLKDNLIAETTGTEIVLKSITLTEIPDGIVQSFIHSILIAF